MTTMLRRGVAATQRPEEALPARAAPPPRARPHLCFVAPAAWSVISADPAIREVGGAEVQQTILARLFAANGYPVSMICHDYGQPEHVRLDGVTVHKASAPHAGLPVLRFVHPRLTRMWRALRVVDADIYYCRAAGMLVGLVAQFCRLHGKRAVYAAASNMDFADDVGGQIRYARDRWLYRRGLKHVDRIVAQNEPQRSACLALTGRDAVVIPSCYEPPAQPAAAGGDCVLWVGTIKAGKRPGLLLEIAARLPHRRFVMVGGAARSEAALFEQVRREAARLPNVELTGFVPFAQVDRHFDAARVFVNTSHFEGMPNTFLQAWSRGVPTLGTVQVDTPAHRHFRDADEGARAIEALFTRPAEWQRASRGCRSHFERNHSGAETLRRYARLFEELRD
jgi:glycosyltransferase involved in cell wall biosynthesis